VIRLKIVAKMKSLAMVRAIRCQPVVMAIAIARMASTKKIVNLKPQQGIITQQQPLLAPLKVPDVQNISAQGKMFASAKLTDVMDTKSAPMVMMNTDANRWK